MIYDVIVVGGGHNGLIAASYLAKAGKSVLLLFSFVLFSALKPLAQSIGQTKRTVLVLDGLDTEMQIETWNFTNPANGSTEVISMNNFAQTPGFYEGISLE